MCPMDIITKEFPFINFIDIKKSEYFYEGSYDEYFFKGDKVTFFVSYTRDVRIVTYLNNNDIHHNGAYNINSNCIIEDLYKYLPKEFYIQNNRDKKINEICGQTM